MKGSERNQLCSCGSGKKRKRCEHPVKSPYEGVRVVDIRGPDRLEVDAPRNRLSLGAVAVIASMVSGR